jgi:hypothetical protein
MATDQCLESGVIVAARELLHEVPVGKMLGFVPAEGGPNAVQSGSDGMLGHVSLVRGIAASLSYSPTRCRIDMQISASDADQSSAACPREAASWRLCPTSF